MKKTKILTLSSLLCALSVSLLYVGTFFPVFDITFSAGVSLLVVFAVIEINKRSAFAIYFVTAILSILLLPDKSGSILYAAFFGYYPIIKSLFERFIFYASIFMKSIFFIIVSVFIIVFASYFFKEGSFFHNHKFLILYVGVFFLFVYDTLLTQLITVYMRIIRKRLGIKKLFK